jgi:Barstar (barnase inhibitor)
VAAAAILFDRGRLSAQGTVMRIIELTAQDWRTVLDFYNASLAALGAPDWHGRSPDALIDSMIWGGINTVEPPYTIRIRGTQKLAKNVQEHVETIARLLGAARADFRAQRGYDVAVELESDMP